MYVIIKIIIIAHEIYNVIRNIQPIILFTFHIGLNINQ